MRPFLPFALYNRFCSDDILSFLANSVWAWSLTPIPDNLFTPASTDDFEADLTSMPSVYHVPYNTLVAILSLTPLYPCFFPVLYDNPTLRGLVSSDYRSTVVQSLLCGTLLRTFPNFVD